MEAYAEKASKAVLTAERVLKYALEQKEPNYVGFEAILEGLRSSSEDLILLVLPDSTKAIEDKLWDSHVRVNKKFQALLKTFREVQGKKKPVERRKAEKLYLEFIKSSMKFYRGLIQRLASSFTGIPEIKEIARRFSLDTQSADPPVLVDARQHHELVRSCHATLLRLGDLSRYRESELQQPDKRNWGPAKGYYDLAILLDPKSGAAYNQLAVMALADDDHVRAVYYLHRAVAVQRPFPNGPDNIKIEFEKLLKFRVEDMPGMADTSEDVLTVLQSRVLRFHADCHSKPQEFVTFQKQASSILGLIAIGYEESKDWSLDQFLQKMCLINMAAEHLARRASTGENVLARALSGKKLAQETERNCQTFVLLQRFNMMTLHSLLRILARELESSEDSYYGNVEDGYNSIAPTIRRVLPLLRQYSSWLLSNLQSLLKPNFKSSKVFMQQVWKIYVQAMNLLLEKFNVQAPNGVDYLLDEDHDTFSFAPFSETVINWRYRADDGQIKTQHSTNHATKDKSDDLELHFRVKELVIDAIRICKKYEDLGVTAVPLSLSNTRFVYQELVEVEEPEVIAPPPKLFRSRAHAHVSSVNELSGQVTPVRQETPEPPVKVSETSLPNVKLNAPASNRIAMENMVSDLVDQNASHEPQPPLQPQPQSPLSSATFNSSNIATGTPRPQSSNLTAMDLVRQMQRSSMGNQPTSNLQSHQRSSHPSLPSILNTPFAPTAGESAGLSPRSQSARQYSAGAAQRSSGTFQESPALQQRDAYQHASPMQSYPPPPSWSTYGHTPTGMNTIFRAYEQNRQSPSPYDSPVAQSRSPQTRTVSQYGVIGQPRFHESEPPKSGQGD